VLEINAPSSRRPVYPVQASREYDAIVVGARCAGSPTAMLLAQRGYRVLLVDRAAFPSDVPRGHFIQAPGTARLKRWGLLDRVVASGCPIAHRVTFDVGPFALVGAPPPVDGVRYGIGPRRSVLDTILVEAAVAAGAELRERFAVQDVLVEDGRVTGIRGRQDGGALVTTRGRMVIGADGVYSAVARAVDAPVTLQRPVLSIAYWSYWSGVPCAGIEVYPRDRCTMFVMPTNDGLTAAAVQWPVAEAKDVRAGVPGAFAAALAQAPELAARIQAGRQEERFAGRTDLANFLRKPYGPGWALVGDAGYHKDPYTGQGISDAFRDAEELAAAVDDGFSGRRPIEMALADYERRRDAEVRPMFDFTCQLAAMEPPPPQMQQFFAALRGNQPEIDRFLGCVAGTTCIPEFFAPENVQRIIAGAAPAALAAA
jgi:2-polyprenyl-6-methoxyphenol hydroxylase-like FAD-dependent oxidoreductase